MGVTILELANYLKALNDKTRLTILTLLLSSNYCVGGVARQLAISEAAVSQHLKVLKEAGLLRETKDSYFTHYHVEKDLLKEIANALITLSNTPSDHSHSCSSYQREQCPLCT